MIKGKEKCVRKNRNATKQRDGQQRGNELKVKGQGSPGRNRHVFYSALRVPYKLLLLSRGVLQEAAERRIDDIDDTNDDHEPREANDLYNSTPSRRACGKNKSNSKCLSNQSPVKHYARESG